MKLMSKLFLPFLFLMPLIASAATAGHEHHSKHGMILFGEEKTYISHKVYKSPHNWQVLLEITLSESVKSRYLDAKKGNPESIFLFVLDSMDISEIAAQPALAGAIYRVAKNGEKIELVHDVRVERKDFQLLYINELPLSLEPETAPI